MKWLVIIAAALVGIVAVVAIVGAMLPKGHSASRSARFRKPPQAIWDVITGPPTWRPDVRSFEQLSARDGRRTWKEVDSHNQAILYESVEEKPPLRLVTRIADPSLPYGGTWIHEITPEADGCVLKITEDGEVYNPIFRFMSRFVFGHSASIEAYVKALRTKLGE
jgi:hypothetical protein